MPHPPIWYDDGYDESDFDEGREAMSDAFTKAREWALDALDGKPDSGNVEMFVDLAMLRALADVFETVEGANAAGVFSGTLINGDTFGDEDDGDEGGHSEFHDGPDPAVVEAIKVELRKEMGPVRGGWNDLAVDIARAVARVSK
jgi:hypothetical protein